MSDDRFKNLDFEGFKALARDESLEPYERVGFPGSTRAGKEALILRDLESKLTNLHLERQVVIDIGSGCSELTNLLIRHCEARHHHLILIDSAEMLEHLPVTAGVTRLPARFPRDCKHLLEQFTRQVDVILTYSVIQYVFAEANLYEFVDSAASLLRDGGQLLIGDIPNSSMRKRFLATANGLAFHRQYMNTSDPPDIHFNTLEPREIDDAVMLSLVMRYRAAGFDAFLLPQSPDLPMANRREDLLIRRP
ncbi:MAG TPA: SAM-dependent methyltransferase [Thermoanaerobaculia bacterium]